jgi:hypothetical protein
VSRDYSGGQGKSEASHSWEALMYQRWGQECGTHDHFLVFWIAVQSRVSPAFIYFLSQ